MERERELLLMARVWAEHGRGSRCQTLVKIECSVGLLEGKLEKSRDECPVWRSVLALLEPMRVYLKL